LDDDRGASAFELTPEKCTYLLTYTPRRRTTRFQRGLWGKACLYESVTPNAKGTGP